MPSRRKHQSWFGRFAQAASRATGQPAAFLTAAGVLVVWGVTGPLFGFSDTWQLVINTGTSLATFLMVFLIQNTQNRDTSALQIKIDELIRALDTAKNELLDLEEMDQDSLEEIRAEYEKLAREARRARDDGGGARRR